jgi:CheY-like chemotaxis protein
MRILVVEDSRLHSKVVQRILSTVLPQAQIVICPDAFDGWAALKGMPFVDLMILDHNMPFAKGGDFIRKVRTTEAYQSLPIIMLTGDKGGEEFLKCGANAYFAKPFNPNEFKKIIDELKLQN